MERLLGGLERQFYQQNLIGSTNVVGALRLRGTVDLDRLREAIHGLSRSYPILTARIVADPYLRFSLADAPASIPLFVWARQTEHQWRQLMQKELHRKFSQGAGLACFHVIQDQEACEILLCMDHSLVDGLSLGILQQRLFKIYNGESPLPPKATVPMEERFPRRYRGLLGIFRTLRFIFTLAKLGPALQIGSPQLTQNTLSHGFSFARSEELNNLAKSRGSNLFAIFSAAALQTIFEIYGQADQARLSLNTPVSLRADLSQDQDEIGIFIAGHLALYQITKDSDIWALARDCFRTLRQGIQEGRPYLLSNLAQGARKPKPPRDSKFSRQHRPTISISNMGRLDDIPKLGQAEVYEVQGANAQSIKDPFAFVLTSYQGRLFVNLQTSLEKMGPEAGPLILQTLEAKLNGLLS